MHSILGTMWLETAATLWSTKDEGTPYISDRRSVWRFKSLGRAKSSFLKAIGRKTSSNSGYFHPPAVTVKKRPIFNTVSWQPLRYGGRLAASPWTAPDWLVSDRIFLRLIPLRRADQYTPSDTPPHTRAHGRRDILASHTNTGVFSVCPPHCLNVNYMQEASGPGRR